MKKYRKFPPLAREDLATPTCMHRLDVKFSSSKHTWCSRIERFRYSNETTSYLAYAMWRGLAYKRQTYRQSLSFPSRSELSLVNLVVLDCTEAPAYPCANDDIFSFVWGLINRPGKGGTYCKANTPHFTCMSLRCLRCLFHECLGSFAQTKIRLKRTFNPFKKKISKACHDGYPCQVLPYDILLNFLLEVNLCYLI